MRPVRLQLKGFTAYRDEQVLDFDGLDLFAITGPTGSGKTSLLDAMTYALYGAVPRATGHRLSIAELISQGQPRMSVLLEFDVDGRRYRISRSTPRKGQTAVRLERRLDDDTWASFGDGADRIREAREMVTRLIGLDYPAFTRSVLLPQGQFQEFMVGEARERRAILTELLGLELFERMARRAGDLAGRARARKEANDKVLAEQFAGVDRQTVAAVRREAKEAEARAKELTAARKAVEKLGKEWTAESRRRDSLLELAEEAAETATEAKNIADGLAAVAGELAETSARAASAAAAAAKARKAAAEAAAALADAEKRLGTLEKLAEVRATLQRLAGIQTRLTEANESADVARKTVEERTAAVEEAQASLDVSRMAAETAAAELAAAEAVHQDAHRANLVASVTEGLHRGDPCPVCARPLEAIPRVDRRALTAAAKARENAQRRQEKAGKAVAAAERGLAVAQEKVAAARTDVGRCEKEGSRWERERNELGAEIMAGFGPAPPEDPPAEVERRAEEIRSLASLCQVAERIAKDADAEAAAARDGAASAAERAAHLVARLRALPIPKLIQRSRKTLPDLEVQPALVGAAPADPNGAAATAAEWADGAVALERALRAAAESATAYLAQLVDQATEKLPAGPISGTPGDLEAILEQVRTTEQEILLEANSVAKDAEALAARLKQREALDREAKSLAKEASTYRALAAELRADRLVQFLQGEALELLAAAGSERLLFLSQDRYRLVFEDDEFYVEDRHNGDERRNVRTLSGGETFLASLALALALSEQIQSLAVSEKARLESLFIDEGFGALDPENLEIASAAIDQLGGDGRMVGIITHVWELAERLPVRIEVEKAAGRGSRLRVIA